MQFSKWPIRACFSIFLGVLLWAMASHWLKSKLSENHLHSFETAILFLLFHAIGLLGFSYINGVNIDKPMMGIYIGSWIFSGSILCITLWRVLEMPIHLFWHILTPLGGVVTCVSWAYLLWLLYAYQIDKTSTKSNK